MTLAVAWAPLVPYAKARAGLDDATLGLCNLRWVDCRWVLAIGLGLLALANVGIWDVTFALTAQVKDGAGNKKGNSRRKLFETPRNRRRFRHGGHGLP